jgi:CRISP-associated protein Cas1
LARLAKSPWPMTDACVIEVRERPTRVRLETGCLLIGSGSGEEATETSVAAKDIAALVLAHPQISITGAALAAVAEAGGIVVVSGDDALPAAMLLPLDQHHAPARRLAAQADAALPVRKRLWAEIVRAKIAGQAAVLAREGRESAPLFALARDVRSGDPSNKEAHAALYYWLHLFEPNFRRDPALPDQNRLLNYGYAILRAFVARALCGAGLHPGLGLHHRHRNNPFCLADDLMEPLRPVIDAEVAALVRAGGPALPLDTATRRRLVAVIARDEFRFGAERTVPATLVTTLAQRLARVFEGERTDLGLAEAWAP